MVFARSLKGTDGRITYPTLGALIAESFAWQLFSEDMKSYTLKMRCKYLVEPLWEEVGDKRQIELRISAEKWYIAQPIEGATVTRNAREITVKGVVLAKKEN